MKYLKAVCESALFLFAYIIGAVLGLVAGVSVGLVSGWVLLELFGA